MCEQIDKLCCVVISLVVVAVHYIPFCSRSLFGLRFPLEQNEFVIQFHCFIAAAVSVATSPSDFFACSFRDVFSLLLCCTDSE